MRCALGLAAAFVLLTGTVARADLVTLSSGRIISVLRVIDDGERVVLVLRGGGEILCPRSLVVRVDPNEVPPAPPDLDAASDAAGIFPASPYGDLIARLAEERGVDPGLIRAVVRVESGFRPDATSSKGAKGLMQLMPRTARQYGLTDPYEPEANLAAGIAHLKGLLDRFDLPEALAAYNAGAAVVVRYRGVPPFAETRRYVRSVLELAPSNSR
jgi:soluble lytic murein transglycosylase-like protein